MKPFEAKALDQIKSYSLQFKQKEFEVSPISRKDYNYEIVIKSNSEKVKILIYFGKKGNKLILQGNPENKFYRKVHENIFGKSLFTQLSEITEEPADYIGTDESGKGDYFGPLVVCGVRMNKSLVEHFKKIGVKDSKLIDDYTILNIADKLKKELGNRFSILKIKPLKYNELQSQFGNINKLLGWGHAQVIQNLLQIERTSLIICDKFGKEEHINKYFIEEKDKIKIYQYTKAERFLGVAAASIIARAEVVNWFNLAGEKLKLDLPLGASDIVDRTAQQLKNIYGLEFLSKLTKLHFKNSLKLK